MQKIISFSLAYYKKIEVLFHKFWDFAVCSLLFLKAVINLEIKNSVKVFVDYFLFEFLSSKNEWLEQAMNMKRDGNFGIVWEQSTANIYKLSHPKEVDCSSGIIKDQIVWFTQYSQ